MTTPTLCPQCGAPLASRSPHGLCPPCLMHAALAGPSPSEAASADPGLAATLDHTPGCAAPPPAHALPEPGELFGGYRIVRTLGKGGMGAVYEADQLETGRRVALKVLKHSLDSPEARKRFLREGRLAASINHPHSVYVYGTEEIEGAPAISMELVAGGTLQEQVKKQGPLPTGQAVDIILQIVSGLEAAQKLGVLHRDIKPANCFVDADGTVKVGDFGLSISTAPRGDTEVTHAGAFLGTPAFSSPEQLRGDELNVRSDMYSVGVTLYYLLTARTPFEADNMVKLLATVLERPAPSPRVYRPEISRALAAVVLRCLEKQPGDRYRDYAELRAALLPFASAAPTPATLGLRLVAALIDGIVLTPLVLLITFPLIGDLDRLLDPTDSDVWLAVRMFVAGGAVQVLYYAVLEGLWGLTPGKAYCGLRVVGPDRATPGVARALLRASTFHLLPALPAWGRFAMGDWELGQQSMFVPLLSYLILLAMFVTMRRRNGYAAVHDLASGTRVVSRQAWQARPVLAPEDELPEVSAAQPKIGPYHVLKTLGQRDGQEWLLAYDARLLRRVWIHEVPAGTPPVETSLRSVGRVGRLRWLTGQRSETENWDAYEAASGQGLMTLLDRPCSWGQVRFWLLDLTEELATAAREESTPTRLALDRVWITAEGRAKLLDFPAPGVAPVADEAVLPSPPEGNPEIAGQVLNLVATAALEGRVINPHETTQRVPAVPLPLRARETLQSLHAHATWEPTLEQLRGLVRQPAAASRWRRMAVVLGGCLPSIVIGAMGFIGVYVQNHWQVNHPEIESLHPHLIVLSSSEKRMPPIKATAQERKEMEQYFARRFGPTIRESEEWSSPYAKAVIPEEQRRLAEQLVQQYPHVSDEDFRRGETLFQPLQNQFHLSQTLALKPEFLMLGIVWLTAGLLVWVAFFSILAALVTRGGLVLWALGLAVVRRDGVPASRLRMLWRALIGWSPVVLLPLAFALILPAIQSLAPEQGLTLSATLGVCTLLAYLGLAVLSVLLPHRGLPDRLAGTWLVPR